MTFCSKLAAMSRRNSIRLPCKQNYQLNIQLHGGIETNKIGAIQQKENQQQKKEKEKVQQSLQQSRTGAHYCLFLSSKDSRFNPEPFI